jgi:hypothetical protein
MGLDPIVIQGCEDLSNVPLTKCVVKRIVDRCWIYSQPRRRVLVNL